MAAQLLGSIETQRGSLSAAIRKRCEEYSEQVLGARHYSHWLMVYSAVRGGFVEGWIPDDYYGAVVIPRIQGDYGQISDLKALTYSIFRSDAFPDRAYVVNGHCYQPDGAPIAAPSLGKYLFEQADKIVFKVDRSQQGLGVFVLDAATFDIEAVMARGNGVFQRYIVQHPFFDQYHPSAVATLRLTTVTGREGEPELRACYLRLGQGGDTFIRSATHVRVAIDLHTGALAEQGFLANWLVVDRHPDTGASFAGKAIPRFRDCVDKVLALHRCLPFVGSIGWDVAIDRQERVQIMEWNGGHNDIKFSEAVQGPCFRELGWENLWREPSPGAN